MAVNNRWRRRSWTNTWRARPPLNHIPRVVYSAQGCILARGCYLAFLKPDFEILAFSTYLAFLKIKKARQNLDFSSARKA